MVTFNIFGKKNTNNINTSANIKYVEAINKAQQESIRSRNIMIAVFKTDSVDKQTVTRTTLSGENIDVAINNFVDSGWSIRPIYNQATIADQNVIAVCLNGKRIK
jgi:hypothetical protein